MNITHMHHTLKIEWNYARKYRLQLQLKWLLSFSNGWLFGWHNMRQTRRRETSGSQSDCAHCVRSVQWLCWEWASRFGSSNAPGMQLEMRNIHSHSSIANLDAWNKLHFFRPQRTSQSYLFLAVSLPRLHPLLLLLAHVTFPLAPNLFCPAALGPLGRLASGSLNPARPFSPFVFPSINCHA